MVKCELGVAFERILDVCQIPQYIIDGLIYLIPKEDDPSEDISEWSPLMILNTIYKILAKSIKRQLRDFMHAFQS